MADIPVRLSRRQLLGLMPAALMIGPHLSISDLKQRAERLRRRAFDDDAEQLESGPHLGFG